MRRKFGEAFKEYITDKPEEIFAIMKSSRFAGELSGRLSFPFEEPVLKLLKEANPLSQRYYYIEDEENYGFFTVYDNRMNLFTYGKAEWYMNIHTVAFPCSLSCSGIVTNNTEWVLSYVKTIKGCKLVLNLDEPVKTQNMSHGETLPSCVLTLQEGHTSLEAFTDSLRSTYRRRLKLALNRCQDVTREYVTDDSTDVHPLYLQTYEKSDYKLECLDKVFFDRVDGEKIIFRRGGEPAGFVLLHKNGEELIFMLCGMDYHNGNNADLYYYMLLSIVEYAILHGCKTIDFGQTSEKTKLKFGAELKKKYFYAHHSNPFLNLFAIAGKHMLEYKYDFPEFHVFKEQS